jgi:hypothetical protein
MSERCDGGGRFLLTEAERAAQRLRRREDPVEAVEHPLVDRRVVLERAHDARDDRALRRAVRAVKEDEPIRASFAHEVRDRPIDLLLDLLLTDERVVRLRRVPGQIEQTPAREAAPRLLDAHRSVVIEAVAEVAAGVARMTHGIAREEIEVFREREDAPPLLETLLDALGDVADLCGDTRPLGHEIERIRISGR